MAVVPNGAGSTRIVQRAEPVSEVMTSCEVIESTMITSRSQHRPGALPTCTLGSALTAKRDRCGGVDGGERAQLANSGHHERRNRSRRELRRWSDTRRGSVHSESPARVVAQRSDHRLRLRPEVGRSAYGAQ